jgi:hypothetical protein
LDNSFAQLIDANFPVLRGSVPQTSASERLYAEWKNEDFDKLVQQTKSASDAGFTDAIFFLYDLSGKGADDLIELIKGVKARTARDRRTHDASFFHGDSGAGVTILSEPSSIDLMRKKLFSLSVLRKYKSKADLWLGLGCLSESPRLVHAIVFNNHPWEKDGELEKLVDRHMHKPSTASSPSGRKIARNEPCGSGKKFKRCHGA